MAPHSLTSSPISRTGAVLGTVFCAQFLVALDASLVNVALPDIARDLNFSDSALQWVISAYLLTFAGFMLLGGRLGDLWGRRRVLIAGLTLFLAASSVGAVAWSPGVLVLARGVQGVAGALIAPAALALVTTLPEGTARRRALGLWGAAGAGGGAVGVVLSGVLSHAFGWRAVLLVNIPIVVVAIAVTLAGVPASSAAPHRRHLDVAGALLVTAGVGVLIYGVVAAGDFGWSSPRAVASFVAATALIGGFVIVEARVTHPLMPLHLFATRSIVGANVFGFMLSAGQLAAFYFASLQIQNVWGVSPELTGCMFVPFCVFVVVGIVVATKLSPSLGPRLTLTLLGVIGAAGLAGFAMMPDTTALWSGVLFPSVLGGIGIGGSMVVLGAAATTSVAPADVGVASGVLNSSRQLGGTLGLAVLAIIAAQVTRSSHSGPAAAAGEGYTTALAISAVLLLIGSLLAFIIIPSPTTPTQHTTPAGSAEQIGGGSPVPTE